MAANEKFKNKRPSDTEAVFFNPRSPLLGAKREMLLSKPD
jgi:hypothetical protein